MEPFEPQYMPLGYSQNFLFCAQKQTTHIRFMYYLTPSITSHTYTHRIFTMPSRRKCTYQT